MPVALAAGTASTPFEALVVDRVTDGSFESGFVSLTLPASVRFPLFASGWAARGAPGPVVVEDVLTPAGRHALELRGAGAAPVQVVQDLPLTSRATSLWLAFRVVEGTQTVRLLTEWDRGSTTGAAMAVELVLGPAGIDVGTPAGAWRLDASLADGRWHRLEVVADVRTGMQTVTLDGRAALSVPGIGDAPPRTLMLEAPADRPSHFRWDDLGLAPLADLELQLLRGRAMLSLGRAAARWLLPRLEAAAMALGRGQKGLAVPELRAARNQLTGDLDPATRGLHRDLGDLLALLEAERRLERSARR